MQWTIVTVNPKIKTLASQLKCILEGSELYINVANILFYSNTAVPVLIKCPKYNYLDKGMKNNRGSCATPGLKLHINYT